jgi:hypothetical protein
MALEQNEKRRVYMKNYEYDHAVERSPRPGRRARQS